MPRRALLLFVSLVLCAVWLAACATSSPRPRLVASALRSRPHPPPDVAVIRLLARGGTLLAASREAELFLHAAPGTKRPTMRIDADNPWGQPLRLLVVRDATDDDGDVWLRVQLPIWPNGRTGWVAAADVRVAEATDRLVVDLSARSLVRTREGRRVMSLSVAIGATATPTPPGRYFVWAKIATGKPSGPYGSYIIGLSGFSEAIEPWTEWPGEPRLAIHGTDDAGDAGHAVSNGCVRVSNSLLPTLRDLPMGTPVIIRP